MRPSDDAATFLDNGRARIFQLRTGSITIEADGSMMAVHEMCSIAAVVPRVAMTDELREGIADHLNTCRRFEWPVLPSGVKLNERPTLTKRDVHVGGGTERTLYFGVVTEARPCSSKS